MSIKLRSTALIITLTVIIYGCNNQLSDNQFIDSRDGEVYGTVKIGEQIWMSENLRFDAPESKLNPEYSSPIYGRLYNSKTVQAVCPEGWHLPTDKEWSVMEMHLGMEASDTLGTYWRGEHGTLLKSDTTWGDSISIIRSGFNALPAGYYWWNEPDFGGYQISTGFWSAEANGQLWVRFVGLPTEGVNRYDYNASEKLSKELSISCRCIKDQSTIDR